MILKNSKILITGGSAGIGKATAKLLTDNGAKVGITARGEARLQEAAKETGAFPIHADVSMPEDVRKTYAAFMEQFGKLDVLINNAGFGLRAGVDELEVEQFEKVFSTNVYGAAMMAREAAKFFKKQKYGNIINIGSTAAERGYPGGSVYVSSKFALRGMTDCWKHELRKYNVRVMLVNPSEVRTAFGTKDGKEKDPEPNKLRGEEIAHVIKSLLELDDRGFVPQQAVWATNPW